MVLVTVSAIASSVGTESRPSVSALRQVTLTL